MASQLVDLPFDVVRRLWSHMRDSAQVSFVCTCKKLYQDHALAVVSARIQQHISNGPVLLALAPQRTLVRRVVEYAEFPKPEEDDGRCTNDLCDDDSEASMVVGSSIYKRAVREDWVVDAALAQPHALEQPFVISRVAYSPDKTDLILHAVFPNYTVNDHSVEVAPSKTRVDLSYEFKKAFHKGLSGREFSYRATLASTGYTFQRLENPRAWRLWYIRKCPECSGGRTICPGCGGVSRRWPEAFTSCGFDLPCPMCVGYDIAIEGVSHVRKDDQRSLDELLNVAIVNAKVWTKDEWEANLLKENGQDDAAEA